MAGPQEGVAVGAGWLHPDHLQAPSVAAPADGAAGGRQRGVCCCRLAQCRPSPWPRPPLHAAPRPTNLANPRSVAPGAPSVCSQLGQQDVDEFIKKLVETGQPIIKAGGLGKNSLSAMGAKGILGAPAGVESNNFDGQRGFTGLTE